VACLRRNTPQFSDRCRAATKPASRHWSPCRPAERKDPDRRPISAKISRRQPSPWRTSKAAAFFTKRCSTRSRHSMKQRRRYWSREEGRRPNCRQQTVKDSSPAGLIAALARIDPTQLIGIGVMDLFGAEKIATVRDHQSAEACRLCGKRLVLVRVIIDSDTGTTYRMFECKCGERVWND
jgi:hypothetical protein